MKLVILLSVLLSVPAFAQDHHDHAGPAEHSAPAASPSTAAAHATTGAEPGSYEDWCGEHEVPESQCTRCNKELIPAFKATNDWCAEHGLPESHCKACNPQLEIKRPSKEK